MATAPKLVDQYGKPVKSAPLVQPLGEPSNRKQRLAEQAAITPEKVYSAIKSAELGETVQLQDLLFRVSLDPRVTSDAEKRVGKLALYRFDVRPYEAEGQAVQDRDAEIAAFCRDALNRVRALADTFVHLGWARLRGWSVAEIQWGFAGNYFVPLAIRPRPTRNYRPMLDASESFEMYTDQGWAGAPLEPYRHIVHSLQCDGSVLLGGLLLRCVFPVAGKNWTLTQWNQLLDLVGTGITDVTYDEDKSGSLKTAKDIASTTGRQLWTAMSAAYKINRQFPSGTNAGHKELYYEENAAISEVLTGARLTTDQGQKGTQALGTVHQDNLDDLREGDATRLAETITDQLIVPLVVFNFGPQERYPYAVFQYEKAADLAKEIAVDKGLHEIGANLSASDLYDRYGRRAPESIEDLIPGAIAPAAGAPPAMAATGKPRAFSAKDTTATDEVLALDETLQKRALNVVEQAADLKAAIGGLRELVADVERAHTGRIAYEVYRTSALAHLAGLYRDMAEHNELPSDARAHAVSSLGRLQPARLWSLLQHDGLAPRPFATVIDEWADVPFQEAVDWFKRRGIVTAEQWAELDANYRHRAFYSSKIGTVNELRTVHDGILRGLESGASTQDVVRDLRQRLTGADGAPTYSRSYLRFLFDENVSAAQSFGRYQRQERTRDVRPYGRYVHFDSEHPRPAHVAIDGTILPLDNPWWAINTPKNGYGCHCERTTLDGDTIERRGWKVNDTAPGDVAEAGFDTTPDQMAAADERMSELKRVAADNELLYGYSIPDNVIVSTAAGKLVLVGERSSQ